MDGRWNNNLHAFDALLERVPPGAARGLDVGCGEGETARRLRARVAAVVGIDPCEASIAEARVYRDDIDYVVGDVMSADLGDGDFDVVTAVAVIHHLDQRRALQRLGELVRPGGLLLVVGFGRSRSVADFARDVYDRIAVQCRALTTTQWHTPAPKLWPPPETYREMRAMAAEVLPGSTFGRLAYFRYGLTWVRPDA